MRSLPRLTNLTQLDLDVTDTSYSPSWWPVVAHPNDSPVRHLLQNSHPKAHRLLEAIQAVPSLKKVGVHSACDCLYLRLPDPGCDEVHRTLNVMFNEMCWSPCVEEQVDEASRPHLASLVVYFRGISSCPSLHGCSVLRELVLAHCSRQFASVSPDPFSVVGLEAVAGTLTRLVVSTDRALTIVHMPTSLRLQSLMLVCPGTLAVHGDVLSAWSGIKEALFGYAEVGGDTAELTSRLSCRLSSAELEVFGSQPLRQGLMFTHPALVGQWWHGVYQKSMSSIRLGSHCCRVRVWKDGRMCPPHTTFARYGIMSAHDDRDVWLNRRDLNCGPFPDWYSQRCLPETKC
jgi:hypothetical protein